MNGFLHAFIISYTKERGNAHSSPTYSLWSLKWESPARNRMKEQVQPAKPAKRRLSYKEQKEWEEIEDKIAALETKLQEITLEMEQAASDYEKVQRLASEHEQLSAELDALLESWAELSELVEALQSK